MTRGKTKRLAWGAPYKKYNEIYKDGYEKIFKKRKPKHANSH